MTDDINSGIVVVDTDVISFIFKQDTRNLLYQPHLDGRLVLIAAQTRAELELWSLQRNWGWRRRNDLLAYLKNFVFAGTDEVVASYWASVQDFARRTGHPISCADGWIAATALAFAAPLVTHNPTDFAYVPGLTLVTEN
jgi:tRNA(fMet)-specific endonuclease VapC